MKKWNGLLVLLGVSLLGMTGCEKSEKCEAAQKRIIEPVHEVRGFLSSIRSGEELEGPNGCEWMRERFRSMPESASLVRDAAGELSRTNAYCVRWADGWRESCTWYGYPGRRFVRCHWVPYTYCARYEYRTTPLPGHRNAMDLSRALDEMYALAQQTCMDVSRGKLDEAFGNSQRLLDMIEKDVIPNGEIVMSRVCD